MPAAFNSFWPGANHSLASLLQDFALNDESGTQLLIGPHASGKSHLAQAACRARWDAGRSAAYLPIAQAALNEDSLAGIAAGGLIVVDDLPALRVEDELPLLRLIDRSRAANGKLLMTSAQWPQNLAVQTPDLRSRMQWGAILELKPLNETELQGLLQHRAALLGVAWSERLSDYLLRRLPRAADALVAAQDEAYRAAIAQGRKITVPFLRELIA